MLCYITNEKDLLRGWKIPKGITTPEAVESILSGTKPWHLCYCPFI